MMLSADTEVVFSSSYQQSIEWRNHKHFGATNRNKIEDSELTQFYAVKQTNWKKQP